MLGCGGMPDGPAETSIDPREVARWREVLRPVDALLEHVARRVRVLPSLMPNNAASERARLVSLVAAGETPAPSWEAPRRASEPELRRGLDAARMHLGRALDGALRDAYVARLDELEVDLAILEVLGDPASVRPLAARRYGTGARQVMLEEGPVQVGQVARGLLASFGPAEEARARTAPEVAARLQAAASAAGIPPVEVRIEPRLVAGAATGERVIFLADRCFGEVEARRLVAHEVAGHAVVAANAAVQPLRLLGVGTAGAFADQEGLALCLEALAGALDTHRLRVLAARVVSTDGVHAGASFGETARLLHHRYEFSAETAVQIAERAFRGGGVARDAGYLFGYLRVGAALRQGRAGIDARRAGRVGLDDLGWLQTLGGTGIVRAPRYRPTLDTVLAAAPP